MPLRNRSDPQGRSDQSGSGLRREWRMEDGGGRAGNMVYVQGWVVGAGGGGAVENDTQTEKSTLRNCQIWRVLLRYQR